jgi:glycosyltransferase involved in cell wall biosynthesis
VLHIIPTARARGAQREARALATRLDVPGTRDHRLMSLFVSEREVPVDYALDHDGGATPAMGFDPRLAWRLRAELGRLSPTVVVAHGGDPLKYLVPATVGRRVPLVYYATGTFSGAGRLASELLWRTLVRRADVVAAEGEEVLQECSRVLRVRGSRLVLAPNGRDPEEFIPRKRASTGPAPEIPVVVFVGALTTGKRPDRFIELIATLRRRGVTLRAVVCGDGPLAGELVAPAQAAGVELLGSRSDVATILRDADVFVFPSLPTGEGMPGVLIEAGLSGLPVVASAVPGVTTIVEDDVTGFVVDADDAMVHAVARLLDEPELRDRMGSAARRRCVERFSLDAVASCWWAFLEPLVARGTTRAGA